MPAKEQAFLPMEGVSDFGYSMVSRTYGESQETFERAAGEGGSCC